MVSRSGLGPKMLPAQSLKIGATFSSSGSTSRLAMWAAFASGLSVKLKHFFYVCKDFAVSPEDRFLITEGTRNNYAFGLPARWSMVRRADSKRFENVPGKWAIRISWFDFVSDQ